MTCALPLDATGLVSAVSVTPTPDAIAAIAKHPWTSEVSAIAGALDEGADTGATEIKAELGLLTLPSLPVKEEFD